MKLADVMNRNPLSVRPDSDLALAGQMMLWANTSHLPVTDGEGKLLGLLSDRAVSAYQARDPSAAAAATASDVMIRDVETGGPDDAVTEAAGRFRDHRIACLPVTELGHLVGVVTTTDILAAMFRQAVEPVPAWGPTVADAMTPDPATIHPDDHILDAAARMKAIGIRHLPVVDGNGAVIGILSDRDVRAAIGDPVAALRGESPILLEELRVGEAMTARPDTTTPDKSCAEVAAHFATHRGGALPVVDDAGVIVGMLSYVDVLRALAGAVG